MGILLAKPVEIPPRHAVLCGDDGGVRPEQRAHMLGCLPGLMGLEADDDIVLRSQLKLVIGGRHVLGKGLLADIQR
jgi:hypothetical protein